MRNLKCAALLAVFCLIGTTSKAQTAKVEKVERTIASLVADLNKEMRGYERELKYFQRVPEFKPLSDLRTQLVNQTAEMTRLDTAGRGSGPAVRKLAKEMDRTARQLNVDTTELEKRAEAISNKDGRVVAERMRNHAVLMAKATDRLVLMFR